MCWLTVVLAAYYANRESLETGMETPPLKALGGRVQRVSGEQDVGIVQQGLPLSVVFSVANSGSDTLSIRQLSIYFTVDQ